MQLEQIPVEQIKLDGKNPRRTIENINELKETILKEGVLQPIIVDKDDRLIIGHRRLQACKEANIKKIPVIRKDIKDDTEILKLRLLENLCRVNIKPLEKANAIQKLKEITKLPNHTLAKKIGISERMIYNYLKIVNMPEEMNLALENGQLTFKEILKIRSLPQGMQYKAFQQKMYAPKITQPKDFLRKAGAKIGFGIQTSKIETWQHFIVKALVYKLLYDKGKSVTTEYENYDSIADVIDLNERIVYEVEGNITPEKTRQKIDNFKNFNDVIIIDLNKVPKMDKVYDYIKEFIT